MIYTSYFANIKKLPNNYIPISICGKAPDWYKGLQYKKLAPKWEFFKKWKETKDNEYYIEHFQKEVLILINQEKIIQELESLIKNSSDIDENIKASMYDEHYTIWNNPNINIVLICYEKPNDFCHRHLVAKWLTDYGYPCKEYISNEQLSLF